MIPWLKALLPAVVLLLLGTLLAALLVPAELEQMQWEVPGMPDSYPLEQQCRPLFLLLLCYLPFIGSLFYAFMGTMDRYMTRQFLTYFLMCTAILLLIYLLADFSDHMERFRTRFDNPLVQTLRFYGMQLPMFLYQILPYTLLMGTLWCLSRLSGTSEITGMLQSGRSLLRVCRPVFLVSVLVAVAYGIFGFHWAPGASVYRQAMLKKNQDRADEVPALVYRNESTARIWRIEHPATVSNPGLPMREVIVEQFDPAHRGRLVRQYLADKATWNKADATWTLENTYVRELAEAGERPADEVFAGTIICDFSEKPYQIVSPTQSDSIDSMGTAAMYEYIASGAGGHDDRCKVRTEWHVRIARIFSCLILVLLGIPSAVSFQRRGPMKGIGIAVLLAALLLFFYRVFPALGEAGVIQAWISAWIPNVLYLFIALYLFRANLAHRTLREWLAAKLRREP